MTHPSLLWGPTVALVAATLLLDRFPAVRAPHVPAVAEAARCA